MSETEADEPEALEDDAPGMANPPEILVFGMSGGLLGATINQVTDAEGSNIAGRNKTQLVMAPTPKDLEARCKSTLIAQFGLTQEEADSLIPSAMVPLATPDGSDFVQSTGGTMTGPLLLADPQEDPLEAVSKGYVDTALAVPDAPAMGATDGSEAPAGVIGEYLVTSNTTGVPMVTAVPITVSTISLTAGDWEIWGAVDFQPAAGVSPNMVAASVSVTPNALPSDVDLMEGVGILNMITTNSLTAGQRQMLMTGQCRSNSAAGLDLYLVAQTTLGGSGAMTAKGYICARRAR